MKYAITGAAGQLGSELCKQRSSDAVALTRKEVDLSAPAESIKSAIRDLRPDVIINTAAYTNVDRAEEESAACFKVNADAVIALSEIADELGSLLVQISTDYVFSGDEGRTAPYCETNPANPQGVYAQSKHQGELNASACKNHLIIRTCGLYSACPTGPVRGRNFVDTMLALAKERDELSIVNDQRCTPTYVPDLARAIGFLVESNQRGTFHVTSRGEATWFEFAGEIFRQAGVTMKLKAICSDEFGAKAPRPGYSVLNTNKYHSLTGSSTMQAWQDGLRSYFDLQVATAH